MKTTSKITFKELSNLTLTNQISIISIHRTQKKYLYSNILNQNNYETNEYSVRIHYGNYYLHTKYYGCTNCKNLKLIELSLKHIPNWFIKKLQII